MSIIQLLKGRGFKMKLNINGNLIRFIKNNKNLLLANNPNNTKKVKNSKTNLCKGNKQTGLKNIMVLKDTSNERTLFVKYNNLNDNYYTDIFTGFQYDIMTNYIIGNTVQAIEWGWPNTICGRQYEYQNINKYISNNSNSVNIYNTLKRAFCEANNINENNTINSNRSKSTNLKNVIVLKGNDNTLYVKYNNREDKYLKDVFSKMKYDSNIKVSKILRTGTCIIDDTKYDVDNILLYPYIINNLENGKVPFEILQKSFLQANEKVKTLVK